MKRKIRLSAAIGVTAISFSAWANIPSSDCAGQLSRPSVPLRMRTEALAEDLPAWAIEDELETWVRDGRAEVIVEQGGARAYLIDGSTVFGPGTSMSATGLQIGKLREETFWPIGEGTGLQRDLDRFDPIFKHIVVWNSVHRRIIASQRISMVEEAVARFGEPGIYTAQFFSGLGELFAAGKPLADAVEIGRTFVVPAFQNSRPPALFLIWKTMGKLIERSSWRIRHFTGVASVPGTYSARSLKLLAEFLPRYHGSVHATGVRPREEFGLDDVLTIEDAEFLDQPRSLSELDAHIKGIEGGASGVPPLLLNYLDIKCAVLGVNFDREFNSLDFAIECFIPGAPLSRLKTYFSSPETARAYQVSAHLP